MLKKTVTIIIAAVMICSLAACGTSANTNTSSETKTAVNTPAALSDTDKKIQDTQAEDQNSNSDKSEEKNTDNGTGTVPDDNTNSGESGNINNFPSENKSGRRLRSNSFGNDAGENEGQDNFSSGNVRKGFRTEENNPSQENGNSQQDSFNQNRNMQKNNQQSASANLSSTSEKLEGSELFSERDLEQSPDLASAKTITVSDGKTINITEEGIYVIKGTATDCTIKVEADKESKVQLVLDGVNITNSDFPAIYVVSADKCFVTTTDSSNTLSVTGTFKADGTTNTDAVIFSKDDLVLNGKGTLTISSTQGNGISGKDDIKVTGGTYNITTAKDSIEANESIAVYDGSFKINSSKDAFHSENDEDDTTGWIYFGGGNFDITASSDAVQATTLAQIDGGTFSLTAAEGIEGTYVMINDGTISISSSDDGINAAQKSSTYSVPTVEINGGKLTIVMRQGDTDAIDANGNIIVNGGTIDITAQMSSFDYDGTAEDNGGTIIINGTQTDSIPQSMMGGRGGMNGMNNMNGGFSGRGGSVV